jgi:hypothetical protein
MGKYLIKASHAPEGVKGLMKEGGTGRRNTPSRRSLQIWAGRWSLSTSALEMPTRMSP